MHLPAFTFISHLSPHPSSFLDLLPPYKIPIRVHNVSHAVRLINRFRQRERNKSRIDSYSYSSRRFQSSSGFIVKRNNSLLLKKTLIFSFLNFMINFKLNNYRKTLFACNNNVRNNLCDSYTLHIFTYSNYVSLFTQQVH